MSHIDEGELTAYADGAWAPGDPEAQRIAAHLATCENCRNQLEQMKQLSARASQILASAAPPHIEMRELPSLTPARRRGWIPLTWAASIVMAVGLGWLMRGVSTLRDAEAPTVASERLRVDTVLVTASAPTSSTTNAPARGPRPTIAAKSEGRIAASPDAGAASDAASPPPSAPPPMPAPAEVTKNAVSVQVAGLSAVNAHDTTFTIPGLPIVMQRIEGGGKVTEQRLQDGTIVTLIEETVMRARDAAGAAAFAQRGEARKSSPEMRLPEVSVTRGATLIRVSAALPADSLKALAAKIK